jgi:hypothetical protein
MGAVCLLQPAVLAAEEAGTRCVFARVVQPKEPAMQRIAQHLEPVDPGLWKNAGALKTRLTAVIVVLACMVGVIAAA